MTFQLLSPSFANEHAIPRRYTSQGDDLSPALEWSDPPAGTKSFVLVVDDPDAPDPRAPKRTWVHWVLYGVPSDARALPEGATHESLPRGAVEGRNDWGERNWRGPAPPVGTHRYFFKLYALDKSLNLSENATKQEVEAAMQGHIIAQAQLVGLSRKS